MAEDVDGIVFWTKDPAPMLDRLHLLKEHRFYFQFTLTPYDSAVEPNLPPKAEIVNSFRRLSDQIGPQSVVWRYDPILFSKNVDIHYHLDGFNHLAKQLASHTQKCVISFIDMYRHISKRMEDLSVRPPDEPDMRTLAKNIAQIAGTFGMTVETCAEAIDLADLGILHGRCIDPRRIAALTGKKEVTAKDKYQRELCGCAPSVDIGDYNTCGHLCKYCYANISPQKVERNRLRRHDHSPLLIDGEL